MYTFGLGKPVYAFGLGVPYGVKPEPVVPERETGGRQFRNPLLRILSNAEIEALQEQPELLNSIKQQDDIDVTEFIVTLITRGIL